MPTENSVTVNTSLINDFHNSIETSSCTLECFRNIWTKTPLGFGRFAKSLVSYNIWRKAWSQILRNDHSKRKVLLTNMFHYKMSVTIFVKDWFLRYKLDWKEAH